MRVSHQVTKSTRPEEPQKRSGVVLGVLGVLVAMSACAPGERGQAPARRVAVRGVGFDARGISEEVRVVVPAQTRSLTVVVRGAMDAYYALASLETADGVEQVGLAPGLDVAAEMRRTYEVDKVGLMPGELRQSVRLGLFTQVFPDRPGRALPPGEVTLRVATSAPGTPVDLELLMPEEDGARRLPIRIVRVGGELDVAPITDTLTSVLAGGGVDVSIDAPTIFLPESALSEMTEASQPQEPPTSASSQLALLGGSLVEGDALVVYVVDALPGGVTGWSLGTPGPPLPDTVYSGVVVARAGDPREVGRVLAHEVAHYLGLAHVEDVAPSGARHPDALDDTQPGGGNLMERGRALTRDQAWVLSRSALLR